MKILYIITGLGIGGAEVQLISIINKLVAERIPSNNIKIISLTESVKIRPQSNVEVITLNLTKGPWSFLKALIEARKLALQLKPDVVHAHMFHANIFSRFLRLLTPLKFIINSAHSSNEGGKLRMMLYRMTNSLCDITTNVSQMATKIFIEKKAFTTAHSLTVYNGIDTEKFYFSQDKRIKIRDELNIREGDILLTSVGRLVDVKDHANLVEAFYIVKKKFPTAKLLLIGDGPLKNSIAELATTLSIHQDLLFIPHTQNVADYLCASDLFILSSKFEGFPLSIVEAMACKCLCVSTNNGGQIEAFPPNSFLTCRPENSIELSQSIEQALSLNNFQRKEIVDDCYQRTLEQFTLEAITEKWFKIYQSKKKI